MFSLSAPAVREREAEAARPPRNRAPSNSLVRGAREGTYDALVVAMLAGFAAVEVVVLRTAFNVDSWLALAAGRSVWHNGLPQHDALAALTYGVRWVDQQWLSQLVSYALDRVGGLGLLGLVNVLLLAGGLAGAVAGARRFGARARTMLILLPIGAWLMLPAGEVRTEGFAVPLFMTTFYLLAADSRTPSARVYWCLPLLVLWANVHGSVVLGTGLVALRGLTILWDQRHDMRGDSTLYRRPVVLIAGAVLALFITPYGTSIVSYYHATLLNSALSHAVTEWRPVTSSLFIAVPFFALAAVALWSFGRARTATTLWERLALIALTIGAIDAVRNVPWFALAAILVVGVSVDAVVGASGSRPARLRPRLNHFIAAAVIAVLVIVAVATLVRPASSFESRALVRVLSVVKAATAGDPSMRVFADQKVADWLLWRDPALQSRVAFDVRFELLSAKLLGRLERFYGAAGPGWKSLAHGYRLLVLDEKDDALSSQEFREERGSRTLYNDGTLLVVLRGQAEAG